jgi:hypothetical protein
MEYERTDRDTLTLAERSRVTTAEDMVGMGYFREEVGLEWTLESPDEPMSVASALTGPSVTATRYGHSAGNFAHEALTLAERSRVTAADEMVGMGYFSDEVGL